MSIWRGVAALGLVLLAAVTADVPTARAAVSGDLGGVFRISAGNCTGTPHGSYFRMINPTGTVDGPFVSNSDSGCGDKTYTLLSPGTDGGLITAAYQPAPAKAFDDAGNSLAARIIKPVKFFGVDFSASTEPKDLQTGEANSVPRLTADGNGGLSGDTRAFDATWNRQSFNQGGPKPDGSTPGITAPPKGTIDAANRYSVTWTSQIVGGPFNNFTGVWHLEGTFVSAGPGGSTSGGGAGTTPATKKAGAAVTSTTVAATTDASVAVAETATGTKTAASTIVHKGWKAPTGLVLVIALAGVLAVAALVVLDQRGSKAGS